MRERTMDGWMAAVCGLRVGVERSRMLLVAVTLFILYFAYKYSWAFWCAVIILDHEFSAIIPQTTTS